MKIQLASDLHLEFLSHHFPGETLIAPAPDADCLVLAGDIGSASRAIPLFKDWPVPVFYVAGNHEFYGGDFEDIRARLRDAAKGTAVQFLDNDRVDFNGVRFLGTTLWTDYRLTLNRTQRQLMEEAGRRLSDHFVIHNGNGLFTPSHALSEHERARAWLESELSKPFDGKTVVISHHGPHRLSVHPRYVGDALNAAFVSDLSDLLPRVDLWLHGHGHDGFDYSVLGCRVVANPAGYTGNRAVARKSSMLDFENSTWNPALTLDL